MEKIQTLYIKRTYKSDNQFLFKMRGLSLFCEGSATVCTMQLYLQQIIFQNMYEDLSLYFEWCFRLFSAVQQLKGSRLTKLRIANE